MGLPARPTPERVVLCDCRGRLLESGAQGIESSLQARPLSGRKFRDHQQTADRVIAARCCNIAAAVDELSGLFELFFRQDAKLPVCFGAQSRERLVHAFLQGVQII